jgi:restriction system protein
MPTVSRSDLPNYRDLIYPTLKAILALGGSAQGRQITERVLVDIGATDEQVAVAYENNPKSVLIDRLEWARSYAKLGGAIDSPQRSLFVLTTFGKETLALPEAEAVQALKEMDRQVRATRAKGRGHTGEAPPVVNDETEAEDTGWTEVLLTRLHNLTSEGFEEFVMYLLRAYGLELTRVGGTGDQGIDGIGIAPISPVLSSRVAVQAKRYSPTTPLGREVVALFQRDAAAAGAERAVLVTLGRFSEAARHASTATTPTVDLIDGQKLCELVREKEVGIRIVPQVQEAWFDRFDPAVRGAEGTAK